MSETVESNRQKKLKAGLSILLSLCLGLFLADAGVSLLDDTLIVFFGVHALAAVRALLFLLSVVVAILVYLLLGVSPMIPKRFFIPVTLFGPLVMLLAIPLSIYHYDRIHQIAWGISLSQLVLGLILLYWVQGRFSFRWPLVREEKLGTRLFSWLNLSAFVLVNTFVLIPGVILYLAFCASLAVNHLSGSFLALHSDSLAMRSRKYVRTDGKTIQLVPMMHIGESDFYDQVSKSFPTNSVILMEGVTDDKNLLKRKLSYKKMATSLGLAEQHETFTPPQGTPRQADVDVEQFAAGTIELLNLVILLHAEGLNVDVLFQIIQKSQDPALAKQIWDDLLRLRNEHLLKEIQAELLHSDTIVVPWGAAHMPGIAREIQKFGFSPAEAREYNLVKFRTVWDRLVSRGK